MHIQPFADALLALQFRHSKPILAPEFKDLVKAKQLANQPLHWFTDGSCAYPSLSNGRYAQLCSSD